MNALKQADNALVTLTSWVVVYLTLQMTVVVLIGVFARYIQNDAPSWIEEVARYSMIWLSWLGGGLALRRGAHIAVSFAVDALPEAIRSAVVRLGQIGVFLFLAVCVWYGFNLVDRVSLQSTSALGVSMVWPYASLPVGALLMIYHLIAIVAFPWARVQRQDEFELQV